MAATLRQGSPNSKAATPQGFAEEHIRCTDGDCDTKYVLAYHPDELRTADGTSALDAMRAKAAELVASTHSLHDFRNYVWAGLEKGWVVTLENNLTAAGI
jgi:hypothetical protein